MFRTPPFFLFKPGVAAAVVVIVRQVLSLLPSHPVQSILGPDTVGECEFSSSGRAGRHIFQARELLQGPACLLAEHDNTVRGMELSGAGGFLKNWWLMDRGFDGRGVWMCSCTP